MWKMLWTLQSIFRSDRFDLIDKNMLKLLNLERFLIDRMTPFDRKARQASADAAHPNNGFLAAPTLAGARLHCRRLAYHSSSCLPPGHSFLSRHWHRPVPCWQLGLRFVPHV
ncbi:protein of unknown function [Methylocella tundrae]|uniref:Uncharacterized protein n=1 Tax=Methylocella tundrae TaxID=227605 RepID=A0A4U8YWT7_METTU|nr:protein of unknown function [Methylocella tundrae]